MSATGSSSTTRKFQFLILQAKIFLIQSKEDLKDGENNTLIPSFEKNQINGFGMLFYKKEELLYFGNFIEGIFNDGLCYKNERRRNKCRRNIKNMLMHFRKTISIIVQHWAQKSFEFFICYNSVLRFYYFFTKIN